VVHRDTACPPGGGRGGSAGDPSRAQKSEALPITDPMLTPTFTGAPAPGASGHPVMPGLESGGPGRGVAERRRRGSKHPRAAGSRGRGAVHQRQPHQPAWVGSPRRRFPLPTGEVLSQAPHPGVRGSQERWRGLWLEGRMKYGHGCCWCSSAGPPPLRHRQPGLSPSPSPPAKGGDPCPRGGGGRWRRVNPATARPAAAP